MLPGGAPCVVQLFLKALYSLKEISDAKLAYGQLFCVRSTSDKLLNPPRKSCFCAFSERLPENIRKRSGEMLFRKGREGLQKKRDNFFFRKQYITQGKNSQEKAGRIRRKRSGKNNTTEKNKAVCGGRACWRDMVSYEPEIEGGGSCRKQKNKGAENKKASARGIFSERKGLPLSLGNGRRRKLHEGQCFISLFASVTPKSFPG